MLASLGRKPGGDFAVIAARPGVGLSREGLTQFTVCGAVVLRHGLYDCRIIAGISRYRHRGVVLGSGADHSWAADIDIFDAGGEIRAFSHGFLKRIKVHNYQIDDADVVVDHGLGMIRIVA